MYEPARTEVLLTKLLGYTILVPYYKSFVDSLNLSQSDNVLDLCSGSGIISGLMLKKLSSGSITCADVSSRWLSVIKQRLGGANIRTVYLNDLSLKNLEGCPFDKVIIHFSLHDFKKQNREKLLNLAKHNLRDGGKLILREPTNPGHGIALFEMVNLLEKLKLPYTYQKHHYAMVGDVLDCLVNKPKMAISTGQ